MAYLDNSATTAVCSAAVERMVAVMTETYGNPSSLHRMGIAAEEAVQKARTTVAAMIGCAPDRLVFTSGGTESNNLSILGTAAAKTRSSRKAVTTMGEHASVSACFDELEKQGWQVTRLPLRSDGSVSLDDLEKALTPDTALVSIMMVNNETGALCDIAEAVKRVRRCCTDAVFHSDCVQAAGKLTLKAERWGVDLLTVSSHKIHGPKGCGALYIRKGLRVLPRQLGGGQEKGFRSGTEAVPAIVGFGAAAEVFPSVTEQGSRYQALRQQLISGLADIEGVRWHLPESGVSYITNFSLMGLRSETLLHFLAARDVYVSGGSACSKGKRSPVLTAMGLPEREVDAALRVSFSYQNTEEDVRRLCEALHEAAETLQRRVR